MEEFTDESIYPFNGEHKGKKLANVPASHLIWLYENNRSGRLTDYIKDNLDVLEKEEMESFSKPIEYYSKSKNPRKF